MEDTFDLDALRNELTVDEGRRNYLYSDTRDYQTIGIGHNVSANGISDKIIDAIFAEDIDRTVTILDARLPWWRELPQRQQRVMVNLAFNVGLGQLQGFRHFLAAMQAGDWREAAVQLQYTDASKREFTPWWKEVGERGPRMIARILGSEGA